MADSLATTGPIVAHISHRVFPRAREQAEQKRKSTRLAENGNERKGRHARQTRWAHDVAIAS